MTCFSKLASPARRLVVVGVLVAAFSTGLSALTASAEMTGVAIPSATESGIVLAQKCTPPKKQEGCVKDQCTGKYICCTKTSGSLNCTTMSPKKK